MQLSLRAKGKANTSIFDQIHMLLFSAVLHTQDLVIFKLYLCRDCMAHRASFSVNETTQSGVNEPLKTPAFSDTQSKCLWKLDLAAWVLIFISKKC